MYKLYYSPGACSLAVHAVLNEIGVDFELENANSEAKVRSKEFLKINPRAAVPVLKIDNSILREGAAILLHLLENHPNSLLPKSGLEKATALEWLAFANSTLHPAYSRCFFMHRILGDKASENEIYKPSILLIQKYWNEIEERLKNQDYICGNNCTIADILITVIANWSFAFAHPITFGAQTKSLFTKVISRPAFAKALQTEGVAYLANH